MSYTSIEQGRKLLELGLPRETSDMYYSPTDPSDKPEYNRIPYVQDECGITEREFPCWSVGHLMDLMPAELEEHHYLTLYKEPYKAGDEYCCCYEDCDGNSFRHFFGPTNIDACFKMAVWLLENGQFTRQQQ